MMATPQLLHLVSYGDPVLHKPSQHVTFPLSTSDTQLITNMLYSVSEEQLAAAGAPWKSAAGMAAPQWGSPRRIFVIRRKYISVDDLLLEGSDDFVVVINPHYTGIPKQENDEKEQKKEEKSVKEDEVLHEEGCFSIPGMRGAVRRHHTIKATFSTMSGERHSLILCDWSARVFQHETDHIEGRLYDNADAARCVLLEKV